MARFNSSNEPDPKVAAETILKIRIPKYAKDREEYNRLKKITETDNAAIKSALAVMEVGSYDAEGFRAKMTTSTRESMNEEKLMELLKGAGLAKGIIKKREYVDEAALENAIFNGKIDAAILAPARELKEVVTLTIKKIKE